MNEYTLAILVFAVANAVNIFYITALYHRGLAHGAIHLSPAAKWLTVKTGIWITGIDPKAWVCMHRAHHMYSDTEKDPHSPSNYGVLGVALAQLRSYEKVLRGLIKKQPAYMTTVKDLDFEVSWLNRKKLWFVPYVLHVALALAIFALTKEWIVGAAYYVGIMSHPVHGWMVNSLAHKFGYRNFETKDDSTNNTLVSLLVAGEGLQNNHHARPKSANFAKKRGEIDFGYMFCVMASWIGLIAIKKEA